MARFRIIELSMKPTIIFSSRNFSEISAHLKYICLEISILKNARYSKIHYQLDHSASIPGVEILIWPLVSNVDICAPWRADIHNFINNIGMPHSAPMKWFCYLENKKYWSRLILCRDEIQVFFLFLVFTESIQWSECWMALPGF